MTEVDGGWTSWGQWTACSATCADGTSTRTRTCQNPETAHGGRPCEGLETETMTCNIRPCGACLFFFYLHYCKVIRFVNKTFYCISINDHNLFFINLFNSVFFKSLYLFFIKSHLKINLQILTVTGTHGMTGLTAVCPVETTASPSGTESATTLLPSTSAKTALERTQSPRTAALSHAVSLFCGVNIHVKPI